MYAIKKRSPRVHWIIGRLDAKKIRDINQGIRKLSAFKLFQDRRTDIIAYRGAIVNQKGCPKLHWTKGMLHTKNEGPRNEKVLPFEHLSRQTDTHCGL